MLKKLIKIFRHLSRDLDKAKFKLTTLEKQYKINCLKNKSKKNK